MSPASDIWGIQERDRDRAAPFYALGLTDRQAWFPVLVMRHAGVFLERQYCAFTGTAHGQNSHDFLAQLGSRGFVREVQTGARYQGRLYHVHQKRLYRILETGTLRTEPVAIASVLDDLSHAAALSADHLGVHFTAEPVDRDIMVLADPQLLASAVTNLLNNALKYTRPGGHVILRGRHEHGRVRIQVEDECGGFPDTGRDVFEAFGERRGRDRAGLGLGLSISRKAVLANGGDIHLENTPGHGCMFVVEMPLASVSAI